jgi:transcription initiation factor TFIID subunit 3
MLHLAQTTVAHASLNHTAPELSLEISIQDVRMAMQDCGLLLPEKTLEEQEREGVEDTRGVDAFIEWATGAGNQEIRRVALDGVDAKEDYLTGWSLGKFGTLSMLTSFSAEEKT